MNIKRQAFLQSLAAVTVPPVIPTSSLFERPLVTPSPPTATIADVFQEQASIWTLSVDGEVIMALRDMEFMPRNPQPTPNRDGKSSEEIIGFEPFTQEATFQGITNDTPKLQRLGKDVAWAKEKMTIEAECDELLIKGTGQIDHLSGSSQQTTIKEPYLNMIHFLQPDQFVNVVELHALFTEISITKKETS